MRPTSEILPTPFTYISLTIIIPFVLLGVGRYTLHTKTILLDTFWGGMRSAAPGFFVFLFFFINIIDHLSSIIEAFDLPDIRHLYLGVRYTRT